MKSRRAFITNSVAGAAALCAGPFFPKISAAGYQRIKRANSKIRLSVMGVNGRGSSLAGNFLKLDDCEIVHICDVDSRALARCCNDVEKKQGRKPLGFSDFRKSLESSDVDALVIATPDHWHAPAALTAMKAGKQ